MSFSRKQQGKGLGSGTKALGERVTACCCRSVCQSCAAADKRISNRDYSLGVRPQCVLFMLTLSLTE
jgi:hypothetical protein